MLNYDARACFDTGDHMIDTTVGITPTRLVTDAVSLQVGTPAGASFRTARNVAGPWSHLFPMRLGCGLSAECWAMRRVRRSPRIRASATTLAITQKWTSLQRVQLCSRGKE